MESTRWELHGANGFSVSILSYGARIHEVFAPDRKGQTANVVLNCPSVDDYVSDKWYLGATIGRYANRIANGSFQLDGATYRLTENEPGVTLHGGVDGFDRAQWSLTDAQRVERESVELQLVSPDGDQGFPGTLTATVRYTVTSENALFVDYTATTSSPTIVNLTNHSYFNLSGERERSVDDHRVQVFASSYTPADARKLPTGEISAVERTEFDLREPRSIGSIDINYVFDRPSGVPTLAARVLHSKSGRSLQIATTQPALQLFSGKGNGIALEPQHFPDSPHHPHFPSTVLRPGEVYRSTTIYRFFAD